MNKITQILEDFDFVVEVRNFEITEAGWQDRFLEKLAEWNPYVFGELEVKVSREGQQYEVASYQFFEPSQIELAECALEQPCEFTRRLLGYFCFKIIRGLCTRDDAENFVTACLNESMGTFIGRNRSQTEGGEIVCFPSVKLQRFDADLSKYKYADGAELLSRDDKNYCEYVIRTIQNALTASGVVPFVFAKSTCHNPFHYGWLEVHGGGYGRAVLDAEGKMIPEDRVLPILRETFYELWTFDLSVVDVVVNNCEEFLGW